MIYGSMDEKVIIELKKYFDYLIKNRLKDFLNRCHYKNQYTEEELEYLIPYLFDNMIEYCDGRKYNYNYNYKHFSQWGYYMEDKVEMREHLFNLFNDELMIKNILKSLYREKRLKQILNIKY